MKTLALATFKIGEQEVKYADLVKSCINNVPQGGMNAQEIKTRLRLLDVIEKATDTADFEDADAARLKDLVAGMTWAVVAPGIVEFCDAVAAL